MPEQPTTRAESPEYTARERMALGALAVLGLVGVNGAFAYGAFVAPGDLAAALANPVSAAFVVEALVLVGLLGWMLSRRGLSRLHWAWFVALSLVGSIAFSLPVALLWRGGGRRR
jgi:hypothetical protein